MLEELDERRFLFCRLLREELGEQAFWKGMRSYTRAYFGKSVVTADLQAAMEQASL